MASGTPVITSFLTSMPETAGSAALFVDPMSTDEIVDGITRLVEDDVLRMTLVGSGFQRAKDFSGEKLVDCWANGLAPVL